MIRTAFAALAFTIIAGAAGAQAQTEHHQNGNERLMIVNGNSGRVIYDDGRNDLYCVTRQYVAGYNAYGRPVFRRNMRCR